jgi:hypothetical protein
MREKIEIKDEDLGIVLRDITITKEALEKLKAAQKAIRGNYSKVIIALCDYYFKHELLQREGSNE